MALIFWIANMTFITIITTLFYFIGWWAIPVMMMFTTTIAAVIVHFVTSSSTPTFEDHLKVKSDAAASVGEFAKDLSPYIYTSYDYEDEPYKATPLESAVKRATQKAWGKDFQSDLALTDEQSSSLTQTLINWKVFNRENKGAA